jgi:FkbM family methyltransferase
MEKPGYSTSPVQELEEYLTTTKAKLKKRLRRSLRLLRQYVRLRTRLRASIKYLRHVRLLGLRQSVGLLVRLWLRRAEPVAFKVPGVRTPLLCRPLESDRFALWQIFESRELDFVLQNPPRFIIDAGANVGYASVYFANRYPGARIFAIEPEPDNCALFRKNCSGYPNIKLIKGALWSSNAPLVLVNPTKQSDTFRVKEPVSQIDGSVEGVTVEDILRCSGTEQVDLLKIDIEGAEEELFSSDCSWLERIGTIAIEPHGERCRELVFSATEARGFTVTQSSEEYVVLAKTRGYR